MQSLLQNFKIMGKINSRRPNRGLLEIRKNYSSKPSGSCAPILSPPSLIIGGGAVKQLPKVLEDLECQRPLVVTDKIMTELGIVDRVMRSVKQKESLSFHVFDDTVQDPTTKIVENGKKLLSEGGFDCLVALGGGSPMDTAKGINILACSPPGLKMREVKMPHLVQQRAVPLIAIPTTAGTGSEVTRFTVIIDSETQEKMLIGGPACVPNVALVDYEMTLSLPFRFAADTGIDALTHAMEAYISRKASPMTNTFAREAMKKIWENIVPACKLKDNARAKEEMMLAATLAGLAFSNSSVALVHGMSRPIGAHFHIPHGLCNAMLLQSVSHYTVSSSDEGFQKYSEIANILGCDHRDPHTAVWNFLYQLRNILKDYLEVPTLREWGVDSAMYDEMSILMVEEALASGSPSNNPGGAPSEPELVALYVTAYGDEATNIYKEPNPPPGFRYR